MRDLVVACWPTPEPPFDVIVVRAPRGATEDIVVIEHLAVTGRNERLERPVEEAVKLFWRFGREKFGIEAPGWIQS